MVEPPRYRRGPIDAGPVIPRPGGEPERPDHQGVHAKSGTEHADRWPVLGEPHVAHVPDGDAVGVHHPGMEEIGESHEPPFVMIINGIVATDTITNRMRNAKAMAFKNLELVLSRMYPGSFATIRIGR
jgi:hypothetical protein